MSVIIFGCFLITFIWILILQMKLSEEIEKNQRIESSNQKVFELMNKYMKCVDKDLNYLLKKVGK